MRMVLIDMLGRKLLTDIFGTSLLLFEFSCFRNIVLPFIMLLRVCTRKCYLISEVIFLVFCSVLKKSILLNIKLQGRQPIVLSSPNQLLIICVCACVHNRSKQTGFLARSKFSSYIGVGVVIIGCGQKKVLFRGLSEIYPSCLLILAFLLITYFCSSYIYKRRDKRLRSCCIYVMLWGCSEK